MPAQAAVVRQPYLQLDDADQRDVVWRTDTTSDSRVRYGTVQGSLTSTATNATVSANHIVTITGLSPSTKYFYDAGSTTPSQAGGTAEHYFVTAPTPGLLAFLPRVGRRRFGTRRQRADRSAQRDARVHRCGAARPDAARRRHRLHLGLGDRVHGLPLRDVPGHHPAHGAVADAREPRRGVHDLRTAGSLHGSLLRRVRAADRRRGGRRRLRHRGVLLVQLRQHAFHLPQLLPGQPLGFGADGDLAAERSRRDERPVDRRVLAPSAVQPRDAQLRHATPSCARCAQNLLPILEAGGVDLVLCGHSHDLRALLPDRRDVFDADARTSPRFRRPGHILDDGNGKPTGDGAYQKGAGRERRTGRGLRRRRSRRRGDWAASLNHPVMYFSEAVHGSCMLDVSGNTLTLTNVRSSGVVSDTFTIQKGPQTPKVLSTNPVEVRGRWPSLPTIHVTFSTGVTGVDAGDLTVNGSPATSLSGPSGGSVYTFSGYAAAGQRPRRRRARGRRHRRCHQRGLSVHRERLVVHDRHDASARLQREPRHATRRSVSCRRSPSTSRKGVTGVVAGDLRVNGQPATSLSGMSAAARVPTRSPATRRLRRATSP